MWSLPRFVCRWKLEWPFVGKEYLWVFEGWILAWFLCSGGSEEGRSFTFVNGRLLRRLSWSIACR